MILDIQLYYYFSLDIGKLLTGTSLKIKFLNAIIIV